MKKQRRKSNQSSIIQSDQEEEITVLSSVKENNVSAVCFASKYKLE